MDNLWKTLGRMWSDVENFFHRGLCKTLASLSSFPQAFHRSEWERVPLKHETWGDYAVKFAFTERLRKEEKERWAKFHAEREEKQQIVLDSVAHLFEKMIEHYASDLMKDFERLEDEDVNTRVEARTRLNKIFGTVESFDRFYRMYLHARGEPEKIH